MNKLIAIAFLALLSGALPAAAQMSGYGDIYAEKKTCVAEQFNFLEREKAAERMTFDAIAKKSLHNCGFTWQEDYYHPVYEYALKNPLFIEQDAAMRKQIAAERNAAARAENKRVKNQEEQQKRINDCVDELLTARFSEKDASYSHMAQYATEAARECNAFAPSDRFSDMQYDPAFAAAYQHGLEFRAPLDWDTFLRTPSKEEEKPKAESISLMDWLFIALMGWGVIAVLRDMIAKQRSSSINQSFVDLDKTEWSKTRIEPIFDVKPEPPFTYKHNRWN